MKNPLLSLNPFECPICLSFYDQSDFIPTTLPCGHSCCLSHINVISECALCRRSFPKVGVTFEPTFALRDGAIMYSQLVQQSDVGKVKEEISTLIPIPRYRHAEEIKPKGSFFSRLFGWSTSKPSSHSNPDPAKSSVKSHVKHEKKSPAKPSVKSPVKHEKKSKKRAEPPIPSHLLTKPPRQVTNAQMKSCGHNCSFSSLSKCCSCMDQRPLREEGTYPKYIDGYGWRDCAKRSDGYCPVCR